MENPLDGSKLKEQQYANAAKFNIRFYFHARFGTNQYPWPFWVFDQIEKTQNGRVLELGCGNGMLWKVNANRIPAHWDITLSDYSEGMLSEARKALSNVERPIRYEMIEATAIPHPDRTFDIIIANHMLYHIPDRAQALSEMKRVLQPGGIFYASTIGRHHMREMKDLMREFDPDSGYEAVQDTIQAGFSLENGAAQLEKYLPTVALRHYPDALRVTEAQPLVDYVLSCNGLDSGRTALRPGRSEEFKRFVLAKLEADGEIVFSKPSGLFIAQ